MTERKNINISLDRDKFLYLVKGAPIVLNIDHLTVKIILQDIGFQEMINVIYELKDGS